MYYYNKSMELDFYVPDEAMAIQVSYSLNDDDTRKKELAALEKIGKFLHAEKCIIITYNEEDEIDMGDIHINVVSIWKWLLK